MTDLLVSVHTPSLKFGRGVRTYGVARALAAAGNGLDMLYVRAEDEVPDRAFHRIPGITLHEVRASLDARRLGSYLGARLRGVPHGFARGVSPELMEAAEALAHSCGGRVIADGPVEAAALMPLARRRSLVYNAHNFESGFRHSLGSRGFGSLRTLRAFERRILGMAVESWMVSERDAEAARALCPQAHIRIVPNVVDVSAIHPVGPRPDARRALFVGNFTYSPNRTALRFLLNDVFPQVCSELPDARLRVVGPGLDESALDDPRVDALGLVHDIVSAYQDVSCAVVPLLQGGGTPLKFVEALAYGLPVVATPLASAGLAVRDGVDCILAEGADRFASAVVRVLRDGAPGIGEHGRALALERYSIEALVPLVMP